uniref:hypothetical protein n=1 Tax=Pseudomonas palleroniana TaxID=191390 RepID=UPI00131A08F5|nr:hypothetical protein [Pseudomonas palleroniana]
MKRPSLLSENSEKAGFQGVFKNLQLFILARIGRLQKAAESPASHDWRELWQV